MDLLKKYNQLDTELYNYVSGDLFPGEIEKHIDEISKVKLPEKPYNSEYILNYRMSIIFNKFVYKVLLKLFRKRG